MVLLTNIHNLGLQVKDFPYLCDQTKEQETMFDSDEEKYFNDWLQELQQQGFVERFERCTEPFLLYEPLRANWTKQLKTKEKKQDFGLFNKVSYTPDFYVRFTRKALGVLCYTENCPIEKRLPFYCINDLLDIFIDVKGTGFNKRISVSDVRYPIVRRLVFDKYGYYVDKVVPYDSSLKAIGLFADTFCPETFIKDHVYKRNSKYGMKGESRIKYAYKTVEQFLHGQKNVQ